MRFIGTPLFSPLNTFYAEGGHKLRIFQELRLNLSVLRLGCSTIRGYKLKSIEDLNMSLHQRRTMTTLKRNLVWIWQALMRREHGPHRWSQHCRGLLCAQARMAQRDFQTILYGMQVRFISRRRHRTQFFKGRIARYFSLLQARPRSIRFTYRKLDAARITGNPITSFDRWSRERITSADPQKILGMVHKHTRFLTQSLSNTTRCEDIFIRNYSSVCNFTGITPHRVGGYTTGSYIDKLLYSTAGYGPHSVEKLQLVRFLAHTIELSSITGLIKLQYNALTVACAMYIHTKVNLLGYFHTDFDLAFGVDFKSYVVKLVLTLFDSVVSMHDYTHVANAAKVQPESEPVLQKPRTVSRGVFLRTFGTSGLRGEKLPYNLIKFRPGYQIFFRELRHVHKELNHLRFRYQHRMTSYLLHFQHLNNSVILKLSMMSIKQVLLHTRLFINQGELEYAIKYGFIFINGRACTGLEFQLQVGDYVQYRATYHTYSDVLCTFRARAEFLNRGRGILGHHTFGPFIDGVPFHPNHGITNRIGASIFNKFHLHRLIYYYYHFFDTPTYIELDYMLLGFVVVTLPNSTSDYEFIMARKSSVTMIKMLNWKYIV